MATSSIMFSVKTARMSSSGSGTMVEMVPQFLCYLERADREKVLADAATIHRNICASEDERAEKAGG